MNKPVWHKGPPPSLGWWPASTIGDADILRWWDGKRWSVAAKNTATAEEAALLAKLSYNIRGIKWTERPASWPARSRT